MASLGPTALSMRSRGVANANSNLVASNDGSYASSYDSVHDKAASRPPQRAASLADKRLGGASHADAHALDASLALPSTEVLLVAGVTFIALVVRTWHLSAPSSVVFDEVHFGGFATKYINQRFFMDVHPPLGKLLFAFVAWLAGFRGDFDFKEIGKEYLIGEDHRPVPYVAMRLLPALMGVALAPLSYLTLRALSLRGTSALVGAMLVTFDNALTTQSRLILLDSPLLFFTAITTFCWVSFCIEDKRRTFGREWWVWLTFTGAGLGAVASVKWVGFFTIATIGLNTIFQLWAHLGDVRQPMSRVGQHFAARAALLIFLPFLFYLFTFSIHLAVLNRSGEGDAFMSSGFQHTLRGHSMPDTYADVALGSTVSIRHKNTQGGYLHSHLHNYPGGSGQQQITLYPHRDENNEWYIVGAPGPDDPPPPVDADGVPLSVDGPHDIERYKTGQIEFLKHGMEVRLIHRKSDKRLHSHDSNRPPITESDYQNEVTGYGFPGFLGDANDNWHVEIESHEPSDPRSRRRVRALRSTIRFRHTLTGCYLFSHKIPLPDWGFGQQEVTCNKNPQMSNSLWFIETNTHPRIEDGGLSPETAQERRRLGIDLVNYLAPSFWARFKELQRVMWETNAGLTERHAYDSRPSTWPTLRRGINFWAKDHRQIYLIGNPLVWYGALVAILVYLGARAVLMLRAKRGKRDFNDSAIVYYDQVCGFLFTGWAMHYLPFWLMSRQLFIHHYLPALYFSILLVAAVFDVLTSSLRPRFRLQVAAVFIALTIFVFSVYAPITYAGEWTGRACERSRLQKTWDFNCREFPDSVAKYADFGPAVHTIPPTHAEAINITGTQSLIDAGPQAGYHAFEQAPPKALSSGLGLSGSLAPSVGEPIEAAKAADAAPPEPAAAVPQGTESAVADDSKAALEASIKAADAALKVEGLDQEGVEAIVLEGTAAVKANAPVEAAPASVSEAAKPDVNAPGEMGDPVDIAKEEGV
ncbi:glycosyltransferase family 39 protein [Ceraceosorus bombacis]|uniref:Dolichyl-phosphate-mannose--protein mannosyltransferase n=1 Tax=Ceraceosorus bombacis TaxID=401625 RepID=A0A0P1BPT2_9BASI|nr:glycosyltransferase family 39 protein [Ceraceosorus bombacis]